MDAKGPKAVLHTQVSISCRWKQNGSSGDRIHKCGKHTIRSITTYTKHYWCTHHIHIYVHIHTHYEYEYRYGVQSVDMLYILVISKPISVCFGLAFELLTWLAPRCIGWILSKAFAFMVVVVHIKFITNWKYFDTTVTNQMLHFIQRTIAIAYISLCSVQCTLHTLHSAQAHIHYTHAVCLFFRLSFQHFLFVRFVSGVSMSILRNGIHNLNVFTATYVLWICLIIIWDLMLPLYPGLWYE